MTLGDLLGGMAQTLAGDPVLTLGDLLGGMAQVVMHGKWIFAMDGVLSYIDMHW